MEIVLITVALLLLSGLAVVLVGPPYLPTLKRDLKQLLEALELKPTDHVVDLGSGDGRVMLAAAQRGATTTGVELNIFLIAWSRLRLRKYKKTRVRFGNMWKFDLPDDTSYVFVFLAQKFMPKLEEYLKEQAEQGRSFQLISLGFKLPGRLADRSVGAFNIYTF